MKCKFCGAAMNEDGIYCPQCGRSIYDIKKEKNYFKSPLLWILSILMIGLAMGIDHSIFKEPTVENHESVLKITGENSALINQLNINNGGECYYDGEKLYIVSGDSLYAMNDAFKDIEKIQDNVSGYVYVDKTNYYYCDNNNSYIKEDKKTGKQEKLLENAYYVQNLGDKIYYQLDHQSGQKDAALENICVYDIKTKENKVLVKDHCYNIVVIDDTLYYTTKSHHLKSLSLKDQSAGIDLKDVDGYVIIQDQIYFTGTGESESIGLWCYDIKTEKTKAIDPEVSVLMLDVLEDKLVFGSHETGKLYIVEDDKAKLLAKDFYMNLQVIGDQVIYMGFGYACVIDEEGNRQRIDFESHKLEGQEV